MNLAAAGPADLTLLLKIARLLLRLCGNLALRTREATATKPIHSSEKSYYCSGIDCTTYSHEIFALQSLCVQLDNNRVHAYGGVRQHSVLRGVLRRFWTGFWGRVLRRFLRRGSAMGFTIKKGF